MSMLQFMTLLGLTCLCQGQTVWDWASYYNPMTEFRKCGREQPSFICDPNGVLSVRAADHLDHALKGTYNTDLPCPCSRYKCRTYKKGYAISIAIVKKLKLADGEDKYEKGRQFALKLATEKWNFGECDNDIVIFYSADDGVLQAVAGYTPARKMSESLIKEITGSHGYLFAEGDVAAGMYSIITDLREVLKGTYLTNDAKLKSQVPRGGASQLTVAISTLITVTGAILLSKKL